MGQQLTAARMRLKCPRTQAPGSIRCFEAGREHRTPTLVCPGCEHFVVTTATVSWAKNRCLALCKPFINTGFHPHNISLRQMLTNPQNNSIR